MAPNNTKRSSSPFPLPVADSNLIETGVYVRLHETGMSSLKYPIPTGKEGCTS